MGGSSLEQFVAYQKSLELFEFVASDVDLYLGYRRLDRLVSQQLSSSDSVCANIEEGYGRESRNEFRRHLSIARGSLRETRGRYLRLGRWIPQEVIEERVALSDEISRIITSTLISLRPKV